MLEQIFGPWIEMARLVRGTIVFWPAITLVTIVVVIVGTFHLFDFVQRVLNKLHLLQGKQLRVLVPASILLVSTATHFALNYESQWWPARVPVYPNGFWDVGGVFVAWFQGLYIAIPNVVLILVPVFCTGLITALVHLDNYLLATEQQRWEIKTNHANA